MTTAAPSQLALTHRSAMREFVAETSLPFAITLAQNRNFERSPVRSRLFDYSIGVQRSDDSTAGALAFGRDSAEVTLDKARTLYGAGKAGRTPAAKKAVQGKAQGRNARCDPVLMFQCTSMSASCAGAGCHGVGTQGKINKSSCFMRANLYSTLPASQLRRSLITAQSNDSVRLIRSSEISRQLWPRNSTSSAGIAAAGCAAALAAKLQSCCAPADSRKMR